MQINSESFSLKLSFGIVQVATPVHPLIGNVVMEQLYLTFPHCPILAIGVPGPSPRPLYRVQPLPEPQRQSKVQ